VSETQAAPTEASGAVFYYDDGAAQRAVDFFRELLVHVKGEKAGQPFVLDPWEERDIIRPLFGWKRQGDGTRRYRQAYIEVPKKNGKSSLGAGLALYLTTADGEEGAEVYSVAADTDQADIVFSVAKQMRARSPELRKRLKPFKRSLVYHAMASSYKVLSAEADTKHGFNIHGCIFDELHTQPNRKLYDVLTTGTASRRQPLFIFLTTAGYDRHSICWEVHDYALKVRDGMLDDPSFLPVIYAADPAEPWDDPATWAKANPGLGSSVKLDYLEEQAKKARQSLAYQNTFRRLHLNEWTAQAQRAIDMAHWDACAGPVALAALAGRPCFAGLDLASSIDIAALVLVFPDDPSGFLAVPVFWVPEDTVAARVKQDRVPYDVWIQDGLLRATPGNVIDYDVIRRDIGALGAQVEITEIAYDRWGATQLSTQLEGDGFTLVPFGQGFASMAAPTKELLTLIPSHRIQHGGHAVLRWMAGNFSTKQDAAGNLKPDKASSSDKIDGIVALIMGLDRASRHAQAAEPLIRVMG
jgi:phage terminase large subunit-like protein